MDGRSLCRLRSFVFTLKMCHLTWTATVFTLLLPTTARDVVHSLKMTQTSGDAIDHSNSPFNVSVTATSCSPPAVRVSWQFNSHCEESEQTSDQALSDVIKSFQISYQLVESNNPNIRAPRTYIEVPCTERNISLDPLHPNQYYSLQVSSASHFGIKNTSLPVYFLSPSKETFLNQPQVPVYTRKTWGKYRHLQHQYSHPHSSDSEVQLPFIKLDEAVIVVFVLCFWMAVIAWFCHKWGAIRHLEPWNPDFHKRESTDTEVIVDPFSSFSATHYHHPKLQSRMNTLNNNANPNHNNNSVSVANFASLETNPGINLGEEEDYSARRTSSMSCMNDTHNLEESRQRAMGRSGSSRFPNHSSTSRLYRTTSPAACNQPRRSQRPPLVRCPELNTQTTFNSIRSCRPSFSTSSSNCSPTRRRSSFVPNYSCTRFGPSERITSNPGSKNTSPTVETSVLSSGRHHSLMPLPLNFQLSSHRKIKSAGDLVLELTLASRRERALLASRDNFAESSFH